MNRLLILIAKLIGALVLFMLLFALFSLLRPSVPLEIGRDTTFIESPLDVHGIPNYAKAMDARRSEGVTPETNGAVDLWQAIGPVGEMTVERHRLICECISATPVSGLRMVELDGDDTTQALAENLKQQYRNSKLSFGGQEYVRFENVAKAMLQASQHHAWLGDDLPVVGEVILANKDSIRMLDEISKKPRFYSPLSFDESRGSVHEMSLDYLEAIRAAVKVLSASCMNRLAKGDVTGALENAKAIATLGSYGRGASTVDLVVDFFARSAAFRCYWAILSEGSLDSAQASDIATCLTSIGSLDLKSVIDGGERFACLDAILAAVSGIQEPQQRDSSSQKRGFLVRKLVDPNIPLRMGNEMFDRLVNILEMSNPEDGDAIEIAFQREVERYCVSNKGMEISAAVISRNARSRLMFKGIYGMLVPVICPMADMVLTSEAERQITIAAACLEAERSENGAYPSDLQSIDDRLPQFVRENTGKKTGLFYRRLDRGYILYTPGKNRFDDGGNNPETKPKNDWLVVDGKYVSKAEYQKMSVDGRIRGDDWALIMPLPKFDWTITQLEQ